MVNKICVTFDIDWAPDFVLDYVLDLVKKSGIHTTWFVTHNSKTVKRIIEEETIEAGIHPNFLAGSTQGDTPDRVMNKLMKIVPGARSVRTHAMVYSASISRMFATYGLTIDSSLFLGGMANIQPFVTQYPDNRRIIRAPYFWSDDGEITNTPKWEIPTCDGLKILCFHPIHVYLNTSRWDDYFLFKEQYKKFPFPEVVRKYTQNKRPGVRDYLNRILETDRMNLFTLRGIEEWTKRFGPNS